MDARENDAADTGITSVAPQSAVRLDDGTVVLNPWHPGMSTTDLVAMKRLLRAGLPLDAINGNPMGGARADSGVVEAGSSNEDDEENHWSPSTGTPSAPPRRRRVMAASNAQVDHVAAEIARVDTPMRAFKSGDLEDIGRWYFHTQLLDQDTKFFNSAQDHWAHGVWDMARVNEPMFNVMSAFAMHKRVSLSEPGSQALYLDKKVKLIQSIQSDLGQAGKAPDPLTIVAIAMLAFFDIRDLYFGAAEHHLRAVSRSVNMETLSVHAWLYCAWIDLRYALFTGKEPLLPYYVPAVARRSPSVYDPEMKEADRLGAINATQCPRSPLFTADMAHDLFRNLHLLCAWSDSPEYAKDPPFGQIYDLEYTLRVVHARVRKPENDQAMSLPIELMISAAQIHVWVASRFWTPQRRESHLALITRACNLLDVTSNVTYWTIHVGLSSLLWVLFTFVASSKPHELSQVSRLSHLLYTTMRRMGIRSFEAAERHLKTWPWLSNWHPKSLILVWEMLCSQYPADLIPQEPSAQVANVMARTQKEGQRWFLGGVEFYNST